MQAKCCRLRSRQLATESACLHWRRGSQREPVWLARCCPGPPRPIQVVRSSFTKSESLCSSSIIPQVRWRPSSLDKMLEVSDSGCEFFFASPYILSLFHKVILFALNLFGISCECFSACVCVCRQSSVQGSNVFNCARIKCQPNHKTIYGFQSCCWLIAGCSHMQTHARFKGLHLTCGRD